MFSSFFINLVFVFGSVCSLFFRVGKTAQPVKLHILHEIPQSVELLFRFAREASNQCGSQGDIRHFLPNLCNQIPQHRFIARTIHPAENFSVTMLNRNIQIFYNLFFCCHHIEQFVCNPFRITVQHPHPMHGWNFTEGFQQLRQAGFSIQVFPVLRGILCNDNQFRYATFCKPVGFFQHCFHRYAAIRPSDFRNGTVAATIAASLCNL